jgi:hypothetical protein
MSLAMEEAPATRDRILNPDRSPYNSDSSPETDLDVCVQREHATSNALEQTRREWNPGVLGASLLHRAGRCRSAAYAFSPRSSRSALSAVVASCRPFQSGFCSPLVIAGRSTWLLGVGDGIAVHFVRHCIASSRCTPSCLLRQYVYDLGTAIAAAAPVRPYSLHSRKRSEHHPGCSLFDI